MAYIFQADIYCDECGAAIRDEYRANGIADDGDSDTFPQGPYPDGGGEADCPQHCGNCHEFLENPLTSDGEEYVKQALIDATGDPEVLAQWSEYYGISADDDEPHYTDMGDPSRDEMLAAIHAIDPQADEFDIEAAIYWFASDWHGGQSTNLYSALSTSEFRPGPTHRDASQEGETALMLYDALQAAFGKVKA